MLRSLTILAALFVILAAACGGGAPSTPPPVPAAPSPQAAAPAAEWADSFPVNPADLVTEGQNDFFVLVPGHQIVLEGKDGATAEEVIITVLPDTELVDGVVCRVVEERESKGGSLVEISRNFFAISKTTNDVYYFGEDVDIYRDGAVTAHHGAWRSGVDGARFGLIMPGTPSVGQKYYQEIAPDKAMDRAENISLTDSLATPAGTFEGCLRVHETTPLEPDNLSVKIYARGVGMIGDGSLRLARHGKI